MKFNKFIVGAMLAVSAAASQAAPGPIITTTVIDLQSGGTFGSFNSNFGQSDVGAAFYDIFTFNVKSPSAVDISFASFNSTSKNLSFDSFSLFANGSRTPLASGPIASTTFVDASGLSQTLGAGNYSFRINGTVTGTQGGSYGGVVNISPVPEPETWGLTLTGLAAVGLLARRRKSA